MGTEEVSLGVALGCIFCMTFINLIASLIMAIGLVSVAILKQLKPSKNKSKESRK